MYDDPLLVDTRYLWSPGYREGDTVHVGTETFTVVDADGPYVTLTDAQGHQRKATVRSDGTGRSMLCWRDETTRGT